MRGRDLIVVFAPLALAAGLASCRPVQTSCQAIVLTPEVPFVESEVERALQSLEDARDSLSARDSGAAGEALDRAKVALSRLQVYYLPVLEARLRASNAQQHAAIGELGKAEQELHEIEEALLGVARSGGDEVGRELQDPLRLLEDARLALTESSSEAPARIAELGQRLELMLFKGDLVLP